MRFFIYLTTNTAKEKLFLDTGLSEYETTMYIGSKTIIDPNYLGSSKSLRRDILKYGKESFSREILYEMLENDPHELLNIERLVQEQYNVVKSPRFYNKILATQHFTSTSYRWFHDPLTNKKEKFYSDTDVPHGWVRGSGFSSTKNKKAYHDPQNGESLFLSDDEIPAGWKKGLKKGSTTGLFWFYNPETPSERTCSAIPPKGWVRGMGEFNHAHKGKSYVFFKTPNGVVKRFIDGEQPDSFVKGNNNKGSKDMKWAHDPKTNNRKYVNKEERLPEGWLYGKGFSSGGRPKGSKNK